MAKLLIDKKITGLESSWELYKGSRVREHIMEKCGAFYRPDKREADNAYHLKGFASLETRDIWIRYNSKEDSEIEASLELIELGINNREAIDALVLVDTSLGGNTEVINSAELYTGSNLENIVSTDNRLLLLFRFVSLEYNPVTESTRDTGESATLYIQNRASDNEDWRTLGTVSIPSLPYESSLYTLVDLSSIIPSGKFQVRCYAVGQISGYVTSPVQFASITKTKLGISAGILWWVPVTSDTMSLSYYVQGAVAKNLHVRISGEGGTGIREMTIPLGVTTYVEAPYTVTVSDSLSDTVKVMTTGLHTIEAWLTVDGSNVASEHIISEIMVVDLQNPPSNAIFVINDVPSTIDNYTLTKLFGYGVYNPSAEVTRVTFTITDYSGETVYLTSTEDIRNGNEGAYNNMLEIESLQTSIDAYIHVYDEDGNELIDPISFAVDNSENFSPTSGADFILNPKTRSNNEANPATIINAANGETVPSEFINFGFASDGWILNERGVKVFRVSANSFLNIQFEPYTLFMGTGNQTASLTMEFDIETRNIIDENTPILKVCSYQNDMPLGFELKPLEAVYMTSALQTRRDLDIMFQEDVRTHIAVNIVYNLGALGINYIRLFVNGVINREMIYNTNDTFVGYVNGVKTSLGIRIGSTGADIDIYGIRIYRKSLSATNIRLDYMASMATTAEKLKFRDANDILNDLGNISYSKAYDKYSTILWTGNLPYYLNSTKQNGDVKIHIVEREYNALSQKWEYTVDKAHSGEMKDVQLKGQGTSSMGYYKWNGLFKTSYEDSNGNEVKTNWIDENGDEHGAKYQLTSDTPPATKLVWKINWASPQLSHKLGSCALYTDLWRRVVGGNSVTQYTPDGGTTYPYSNVRVSVILKPFMLFQRATEDSEPVFYGLVTFGPGKADKPTFGSIKNFSDDLTMLEGADNGKPLTEHRVPWMEDEVEFDGEEVYSYNGEKSWELGLGKANIVNNYFVNAFNFIFLHNTSIRPFIGTYEQLTLDSSVDIGTHYWVTQDSASGNMYNLYRWDFINRQWVNASASKTNGEYDVLNLAEQLNYIPSGNNWESINNAFIERRANDFRTHIEEYFVKNDLLYTMCFTKFIAASDNRCKNTYLYCDPMTHKIGFMQDDLDTIFATDNVGRKNKPYYVEEHDLDQNNLSYWNGASNVLYNAVEVSMKDELIGTMYTMLQAMKDLGNGSILACMDKYYFSVQEYIPAVAYNEVARLLYEEASLIYGTLYQNATNPITLSLGDLLLAEKQWVSRRIIYMSSYASFGEFNSRDQVGGDGALVFRSILSTGGTSPVYNFTLTPALWLYPSVAVGTTPFYGRDRVQAGTPYVIENLGADGNTNIYLRGIDYYSSIGNFSGVSLGEAFGLSGARLAEFSAASNDPSNMQFRPTSMTVSADLLRTFSVNGASTLTGTIDLSNLTKVQTIDLRGTSLSGVTLPLTNTLQEIYLPSTITSLTLLNLPNLTTLLFEGTSNLLSLTVGNNVSNSIDVPAILNSLRLDDHLLGYLELQNIHWTNTDINTINYIANVSDASIIGTILGVSGSVTFDIKQALVAKFGNIDDTNNPLYITYTIRFIDSLILAGPTYLSETGTYKLTLSVNPVAGNNVLNILWSISSLTYATIESSTGVIHVNRTGTEELAPSATVTVTMTLIGGSTLTATKEVRFYTHTPQLGDIVFADGSVSDINDPTKTPVGICFYIDNRIRLMVSVKDLITAPWGLYSNANLGYTGVILSDETNAYDVSGLANINVSGTNLVTDANYLNLDGTFIPFAAGTAVEDIGSKLLTPELWALYNSYFSRIGYEKGDYVPAGLFNTAAIITHRNKILQDENVQLEIPMAQLGNYRLISEWENLQELMSQVNSLRNSSNAMQIYFPAASYCYAYEPTVKPGETLSNNFKAHHWWLPSEGELARICFYKLHGYSTETEDSNALFARSYELSAFTLFTPSMYWSSTENSGEHAWYIEFSDGGISYVNKFGSKVVRAVAAF